MTTDPTDLRQRIAEALTSAAFECDGKCGLSEQECYDSHPITFSAMSNGTTHVDASVTAIADAVLAVLPPPADRAAVLAEVLPDWEAVYEPGNVSDYLIGYANDQDAATGMAEAWMRSQAEVTGRLEWVAEERMATGRYDRWFELIERHDDGIDTGPGIVVRRRLADQAPLSPYYEHPECGFRWHGRDGLDIPMRDGQPVCPRCELAKVQKKLDYTQRRRDEVGAECKRRGKIKLEQAERIARLGRQLDEVRTQLGAEILRAGQAEATLERIQRVIRRLANHAVGFQDVIDDSDRDPWAKTVGADIAELRRLADEAQQRERESGCAHCGGDHSWDDCQAYTAVVADEAQQQREPSVHGESVAALAGYQPDGRDTWADDCCGAEPPNPLTDENGREWTPGDCWCTLPPGHDGEHRCQPCTDRHGAPGWTDEPAVDAQQDGEA